MKEHSPGFLVDEAVKLMRLGIGDLYATLGGQLLVQEGPTRTAGIVAFLAAMRSVSEAKLFYDALPAASALREWSGGFEVIYEELRKDGVAFISAEAGELRKVLCNNKDILTLSEQITPCSLQVLIMLIAASLRLPGTLDAISATVAVILLKLGLRDFCRQPG